MANILYEELIDKEFVPISELDEDIPPTYVVLYLKNLSLDTDKKIIVQPVSSLQLQLDNQNPSMRFENGRAVFCLTPPPLQEIGCEGAIYRIMVGAITDGGLISVYVDDVLVGDEGNFMFRLDGIAPALADFDIEVTPYDVSGNEITVENVPGRYYRVERALFKNLSGVYKRIRIETLDADPVNTNYTPENATFDWVTRITTFCLAPAD